MTRTFVLTSKSSSICVTVTGGWGTYVILVKDYQCSSSISLSLMNKMVFCLYRSTKNCQFHRHVCLGRSFFLEPFGFHLCDIVWCMLKCNTLDFFFKSNGSKDGRYSVGTKYKCSGIWSLYYINASEFVIEGVRKFPPFSSQNLHLLLISTSPNCIYFCGLWTISIQ